MQEVIYPITTPIPVVYSASGRLNKYTHVVLVDVVGEASDVVSGLAGAPNSCTWRIGMRSISSAHRRASD